MRPGRIIACVATLAAMVFSGSAEACIVSRQQDLSYARRADVVISGRVRHYRMGEDRFEPFSVSVKHVMSGGAARRITVAWEPNTNIDVPDELKGDYVFILRKNDNSSHRNSPADYIVMQDICSGAYLFPKGSEPANEVRAMFGLQPEARQVPRDIQWFQIFPYGVALLGGIGIGTVLLWPRQKPPLG